MTGPVYEPVVYFDGRDRYLPSILVKAGFFDSVEQIKEFRPDLVKRLTSPTIKNFCFGKERHWAKIVVGGPLF